MLYFLIDTNRINSRQKCERMNELERLAVQGKCVLLMPYQAWIEAECGNNLLRRTKVWSYFYIEPIKSESQLYWYGQIEKVVFPFGARSENEKNDVWILVAAREMNYPIVTNDGGSKKQPGGMLGNADELEKLGVIVLRDFEAVESVNAYLNQ